MATNRFARGSTAQIAAAIAAGTLLEGTPVYDETLGAISIARSATPNTPATYLDTQPNTSTVVGTLAPTFAPPVESGRGMIDYGDLTPGLLMPMPQRYVLLDRPAGYPLPALGGALIEPWEFELVLLPWLLAREAGAGEPYLQVQWFGGSSTAMPLRINFSNVSYIQSLSIDQGDIVEADVGGSGGYRWRRTRQVLLSEITATGRKGVSTMHVQIAAPAGGVEIFHLSLLVGWRR